MSTSKHSAPVKPVGERAASLLRWSGLAILVVIMFAVFSPSASAQTGSSAASASRATFSTAAPSTETTSSGGGNVTGTCSGGQTNSDNFRALDRWGDGTTTLHVRLKNLFDASLFNGISINDPVAHITNGMLDGIFLNGGNFAWQTTESVTTQAEQFCLLYRVGVSVDAAAKTLGTALFNPSGSGATIAVVILAIGLVTAFYRAMRSAQNPTRYLVKAGAILGLTAVLISGAASTAALNQKAANGSSGQTSTTVFGAGSPGWFAAITNRTVHSVTNLALAPLASGLITSPMSKSTPQNSGAGSCKVFLDNLHKAYLHEVTTGTASSTAGILSNMWEGSGMLLWTRAQFGSKLGSEYGNRSACLVLDAMTKQEKTSTATLSGLDQKAMKVDPEVFDVVSGQLGAAEVFAIVKKNGGSLDSLLHTLASISSALDIGGIAYAACHWDGSSWRSYPVWHTDFTPAGKDDSPTKHVTDENCAKFFSTPAYGDGTALQVTEKNETNGGNSTESDYLGSWHGKSNNGATLIGSIAYLISSFLVLLVFGGIALGVIIAKVVSVVAIIFVFFVLLMELLPGKSDESRLIKFVKFFISMSLVSFALGLLLSVISVVTGFLVQVGTQTAPPGSVGAMLWYGFSPIAACLLVHLIFKHVLNMPSPLKPGAAMTYASMASGVGDSMAGGFEGLTSRARNKMRSYGRRGYGSGRSRLGSVLGGAAGGIAASEIAHHHGGGDNGDQGSRRGSDTADYGARDIGAREKALRRGSNEDEQAQINQAKASFLDGADGRQALRDERRGQRRERQAAALRSFAQNPIRGTVRAAAQTAKTGLKVGAAAALVVSTGGLGAGVVGAVLARNVGLNIARRRRAEQQIGSDVFARSAGARQLRADQNETRRAKAEQAAEEAKKAAEKDEADRSPNEPSDTGNSDPNPPNSPTPPDTSGRGPASQGGRSPAATGGRGPASQGTGAPHGPH